MFGDVGDPQAIRLGPGESAIDKILGGWRLVAPSRSMKRRKASDSCTAHQQPHGVVADDDAAPQGEFGMDSGSPVDAVGLGVDLTDDVG